MTPEGQGWVAGAEENRDSAVFGLMKTPLTHHFKISVTQKARFWNCYCCFLVTWPTDPIKHTCEAIKSPKYAQHGLWHKLSYCAIQRNKWVILQEIPVIGQKRCNPAERPTFPHSTVCAKTAGCFQLGVVRLNLANCRQDGVAVLISASNPAR